ncbi:uncharacterized protein LOC110435913 [Sorghum bicolor]|uniref:uncharacterized protein LOC110435913 n=1 Tax=Sorghum bicolor TaxID=4558 RepID=UPI000B426BB9|nr:uncharacterized protein LOC110435913 [Sorghum bicolor]|eukprot:XP_021317693.1 uncharacterized protein LOC110435913 [Sorghum bicolor]
MSPEVLEKAEVQQLLNELFNFADDSFVRSGDRMQAFKLGRPAPKIGDIDRCAVYLSLAPGMENPAGIDPPEDDAAQCPQYTSSEEEQNRPASTTEDRVAGKRPLVVDPSPADRLDVAPATTGRMTSDPPAPHVEPTRVVETGVQAPIGRARRRFFTATHRRSDLAASDVDPDRVAGQKAAEPVAVVGDAAPQTTEQPVATTAAESAEEHPAPARATASTPTRNEEATRTPPPSNVVEEESRAPTPPLAEERGGPILPQAGASLPVGSPGLDQGPVMPVTTAGGSAANEETRTASDDDVEEIQGIVPADWLHASGKRRSSSARSLLEHWRPGAELARS